MAVMVPAVLALVLVIVPSAVEAHGWLEDPPARQFCNPPDWSVTFSAGNGAHGMNYAPGDVKNTAGGVPGLCGDPFQGKPDSGPSNFAGKPCEPTVVYQEGGIMKTRVDVIANHGGWWEMSICDSPDISQECFDRNVLKTVEKNSERWYILHNNIENPNTRNPEIYEMEWKLPAGLTCDHCVVQWSWWTAHRCTFPCEREICGFYADGLNTIALPHKTFPLEQCESRYPAKGQDPQMFRNCADIKITGDGTGGTADPVNAADDFSYEPSDTAGTDDSGTDDSGSEDSSSEDSGSEDSGSEDSGSGGDGDFSMQDTGALQSLEKDETLFIDQDEDTETTNDDMGGSDNDDPPGTMSGRPPRRHKYRQRTARGSRTLLGRLNQW